MRLLLVSLLLAGLTTSLFVPTAPLAQAAGPACPPDLPVREEFQSVGFFGYSANADTLASQAPNSGGTGNAALLTGPTVVCRQFVNPSPDCFMRGVGTAPAIETELLSMSLTGGGLQVRESASLASAGRVGDENGQIPVTCAFDPKLGRWVVGFDGLVDSFFDVFADVTLGGVTAGNRPAFHVVNHLCGLGPMSQDVVPCQPHRAYEHAGGPRATYTAISNGMQADFACHMPFFAPVPAPSSCGGASGPRADGVWATNPVRLHVADVTGHRITSVSTGGTSAPPGVTVTVTPWHDLDGDGVWAADALIRPTMPLCGGGSTIPIEIVALSLTSASPIPVQTTISGTWCQGP